MQKNFLTELNTSDFEAARREDLKRVCVFYFLGGGSFNTKQFVPFGQLNLHTDVNYFDQVRAAKIFNPREKKNLTIKITVQKFIRMH